MTAAARGRLGYRPELDGVRAIAVLAVLGFHLAFLAHSLRHVFRGGFLGVDLFFVLSGMLITQLIVADAGAGPAAELRGFYRRRALRLLPALLTMLVVVTSYDAAVHGTGRATLSGLWSVVSYVTTGHLTAAFPVGVSHVWTLVVEWEFYLVWPAVLIALLAAGVPRRVAGSGALAAAVVATSVRALLFHHDGGNYILSYHLAWLRFDELLVGCALALLADRIRPPGWLRTIALAGILAAIARADYPDRWLYLGGMFALAVATACVVAPRQDTWWADRILASGPMVWVGRLSYSLYLWSVPTVSEIGRHTGSWPVALRLVAAVAASFALAAASYYLVERRFRLPSRRSLAADAGGRGSEGDAGDAVEQPLGQ